MIGLIWTTAAGRTGCERLAAGLGGRTRVYGGAVRDVLPAAFAECDRLVVFLATGAAVRLLAPLLGDKHTDPGVVTVDEAHTFAVALLGGHAGGANALATAVADCLGATPVITTATDAAGLPALDTLPYPAEGAIAAVTRSLLDGSPTHLRSDHTWPLPPLPLTPEPPAPHAPAQDTGSPGPRPEPTPADADSAQPPLPGTPEPTPADAGSAPPDTAVPHPTAAAEWGDRHSPHTPQAQDTGATGPRPEPTPADADSAQPPLPGTPEPTPADAGSAPPDTAVPHPTAAAVWGDRHSPHTPQALAEWGEASSPRARPGRQGAEPLVWVTDRVVEVEGPVVFVRPPSLVVGVGGSRGVSAGEVLGLVGESLAGAGLAVRSVVAVATVEAKREEPGIVAAAAELGVPLVVFGAAALAGVAVPNPSEAPRRAVGTPSVAEAAALLAAPGGELVVEKRKSAMATVAVARREPRGRLAVVGLGPGARDLLTPRARTELRRASVIVGLDQYVAQIRDLLLPGTRVLASGLGAEEERARTAVAEARRGHAVALIGSGDAGVYAMASPALAEAADDIDVVGVPGVTAALAAAALLGAPLGHDHVSISLSDLHTPWEVIERRVRAAAESDLVVTFYNPRSRGRGWQLPKALAILAGHRAPATPVGVVRAASRPDERAEVTTLAALDPATVDMMTVVTVGNTATRTIAGRMVTPRGYRWQTGPTATPAQAPTPALTPAPQETQ